MTNKSKKKVIFPAKPKAAPQQKKKAPKPTPWGDYGAMAGKATAEFLNSGNIGATIGRWLGTGIGSIFGSGDYTMVGAKPRYNVLGNSGQIPKFDTTHATNVICHREYLGDIPGTTNFNVLNYPLQPGNSTTFPWLCTVAQNYQQYRFHGVVFEFRSLMTDYVTNGQPGVVVLATNYNAAQAAYSNKQQMENSEFAVSVKPTNDLMHMIECDPSITAEPIKYVRTTSLGANQDARLYDWGNFQLATQSNPSASPDLGELWVTYCVEFLKPIIPITPVNTTNLMYHYVTSGVATGAYLGSTPISSSGSLTGVSKTNSTLTFNGVSGSLYWIQVTSSSASTFTTYSISNPTLTNATYSTSVLFGNGSTGSNVPVSNMVCYASGTANASYECIIKASTSGAVTVNFASTTLNFSSSTFCIADIWIVQVDQSVTA